MSQNLKENAKKWFRLLWHAGFFAIACYYSGQAHGWQTAFWLIAGGLFYNEASKAFRAL